MKTLEKTNSVNATAIQFVVNAVAEKNDLLTRLENGENLRKVAKEKGFEVVLPI